IKPFSKVRDVSFAKDDVQRIENRHLTVEVAGQRVSLRAKPAGITVVPQMKFPHSIRDATTIATQHSVWGKGRAIQLRHDNGWQTSLVLYDKTPFLQIHTTVANQQQKPYEIDSLKPVQLSLDLGGNPSRLRVLGTGGLTTVAKSQGSYAFSVVADPDNRHGDVFLVGSVRRHAFVELSICGTAAGTIRYSQALPADHKNRDSAGRSAGNESAADLAGAEQALARDWF
ncbi:MAG: hypothetical protein IH991_09650, partial [Planctomycetes bacterium]|nr:hypothetical protein [Planctomycetota bacterium]